MKPRNPDPDVALSPEMTAAEAVRLLLTQLSDQMAARCADQARDQDTEHLHEFRVAVRRTRALLGQLGDVLPAGAVDQFSPRFHWLGSVTGPLRDYDVLLTDLPGYGADLPDEDADALVRLQQSLREAREAARSELDQALRSDRFESLIQQWNAFLAESADAPGGPSVLEVANRRTWKRFRSLHRARRRIDIDSPADDVHALRIECKKLRYLLELFRDLHPKKPIRACLRELKRLQNALGDFNDACVQVEMLREHARRRAGDPDALVAVGLLVGRVLRRQERERERSLRRFDRFWNEKNEQRFRRLFKPAK